MTSSFTTYARLVGCALAGLALAAAAPVPEVASATAPIAPLAAAAPAPLAIASDFAADETSAPDVEVALTRPASLFQLVADVTALPATPLDGETRCLARAVFFEARGEPLAGQLGVAQVILNRVASGRYANSVCGVVDQPHQFTFARRSVVPGTDWKTAQAIALIAQAQRWLQVAPRAMAFHAARVSPNWGGMERVARIGNHVFYR